MELQLVCSICGSTLDSRMVPPGKIEVDPCDECAERNDPVPVGPDADEAFALRSAWRQRA